MRDTLYTRCLARVALVSAARTTGTANGATVDLGVFGNDFRTAYFVVSTATVTDGSHAVTVQESDDGSSWSPLPAGQLQGSLPTITAADDNVLFDFGVIPAKQYLRLVVTTSGATTGGVFSAVAVLSEASSSPVARA